MLVRAFTVLIVLSNASQLAAQKPESDPDGNPLANAFLASLRSQDFNELKKLAPGASIFRMTAPEETQGKSDAEVMEMAKPLFDDLDTGFHTLIGLAKKYKIDLDKLRFLRQQTTGIPMTGKGFYAMEVFVQCGKKKSVLTLGVAIISDKWYVYAIDPVSVKGMKKLR